MTEVAQRTGQSKTAAIRELMREKLSQMDIKARSDERAEQFMRFLREEIWPQIPDEERGRPPLTKEEKEELLGCGPGGV